MKIKLSIAGFCLGMVASSYAAAVPLSDIIARKSTKKGVSLFQAWADISGGVVDTLGLDQWQKMAVHDLVHNSPERFGLKWESTTGYAGDAEAFSAASIATALQIRANLLKLNPNLIIIGEVRYYDADTNFLPRTSPYWQKNADGSPKTNPGWKAYWLLDFNNAAFQTHVGNQCKAMLETGVIDGCLMDWAKDDREPIFKRVRQIIGNDAVLMGNVNATETPKLTPLLNGIYMEICCGETEPTFWDRVRGTIRTNQAGLREPKLICSEIWSHEHLTTDDSLQLNIMRAGATLHYTHAEGYYSFFPQTFKGDTVHKEHSHPYYDFYNAYLGAPKATPMVMKSGAYQKEWTNGDVVYNPMGNPEVSITFSELRKSQATKKIALTHTVPGYDGDIFLKGEYTQVYPGVKELPKPIPINIKANRKNPKRAALGKKSIFNKNQVLIKNPSSGKGETYYNAEGSEVKLPN